MKKSIAFAALALLFVMSVSAASAQEGSRSENRYSENRGFYTYVGLAIAKTNYSTLGLDPNVGFAFGGGYRFMDWMAADVDFYWAGRDQGTLLGKTRQFGITANAKMYPMGLFAPDTLDFLQPYVVMGMGGGNFKFESPFLSPFFPGNLKQGTFIFRIGAGAEVFIVDGLAGYMDLSLHATPGLKFRGEGGATGVIQFGLAYHF